MSWNALNNARYDVVTDERMLWFTVEILYTSVFLSCPVMESIVVGSIRRPLFKSMSTPCFATKSAPIMGVETSAIVKSQLYVRRKPRSSEKRCCPYVVIEVEFAAYNVSELGVCFKDVNDFG